MRVKIDDSNCIVIVMTSGSVHTVTDVDWMITQLHHAKVAQKINDDEGMVVAGRDGV